MPNRRIDQLVTDTNITGSELLPVFSDGKTLKITLNDLALFVDILGDTFVTGGTYNPTTTTIVFSVSTSFPNFSVDLSSLDLNDTYVTGNTYTTSTNNSNISNINLLYNQDVAGGTYTLSVEDTFVTGGTYDNSSGNITFSKNNSTTFTVDLSSIDVNDTFVTGGTLTSGNILTHQLNDGSEVSVSLTGITTTIPDITYTNSEPTPTTVGGIDGGSTFSAQTMQEMFTQLLYPYQEPAFSSFSRTDLSSQYELGDTVSIGNQTFTWSTTNSGNVLSNTIKIDQLSPSTINLLSGSTNDGTELINLATTIVSSTPATLSLYRITATNSENNTFTSTISRSWRARWYYGRNTNTSITTSDITGGTFTTTLATGVVNSFVTFTPGSGYLYLVVPSAFTQPTDFRDSVAGCFGTNVPMTQLSDITFDNAFGVSQTYKIYRTVNQILGTQNIWMCS